MTSLPERFIIFDLEYTAWEGSRERDWSNADEHREIVQIGAVKVSGLTEVDYFIRFVKPVMNPKLSKYLIELTGITQEAIDSRGIACADAQEQFFAWSEGLPLYSMHGHDGDVLEENAELNGLPFLFENADFRSAGEVFASVGVDASTYMSSTILTAFGQKPRAHAHDALSDARSILRAFQLASLKQG